jgi:hypothetical protein
MRHDVNLFLSRTRAATAAAAAIATVKRAVDALIEPATQRHHDGTTDYGFRVVLIDANRHPITTL